MKRKLFLVFTLFAALLLTGVALALAGDPQTLFTDNTEATGPSDEVTVMEQALIDRINAATTSIDLAIYGFDRASIRDALLAAHARGQVGAQSGGGLWAEEHHALALSLGRPNARLAVIQVELIKAQAADFAGALAGMKHEQEDRPVTGMGDHQRTCNGSDQLAG